MRTPSPESVRKVVDMLKSAERCQLRTRDCTPCLAAIQTAIKILEP